MAGRGAKPPRVRGTTSVQCKQPTCGCPGESNLRGYCSPYCSAADHTDVQQGACSCGHRACVAQQQSVLRKRGRETKIAIGPA